jgi:poly(ADP-ribose) glycohydrolase ARH3
VAFPPGVDPDRARGALLGTFVGDALGMPFEGQPPEAIPLEVEMTEARLGRGSYTDDTQMMIALAESLLRHGAVVPDELGRAFLRAYDPRRGYGAGTREVLRLVAAGVPATEAATRVFDGHGSLGNGAAMRIAPVAVRFAGDEPRLLREAEASARCTHAHLFGIDAARAQAAAIAAALRGDDPIAAARGSAQTAELRHRIDAAANLLAVAEASSPPEPRELVRGELRADAPAAPPSEGAEGGEPPADVPSGGEPPPPRRATSPREAARSARPDPARAAELLGNTYAGHESVPTAIFAALVHDEVEQALAFAVRCGGDTDTIAAMTGAIAGARHGASGIPDRWLDALEDGEKGRRHVARLADRLAGKGGV